MLISNFMGRVLRVMVTCWLLCQLRSLRTLGELQRKLCSCGSHGCLTGMLVNLCPQVWYWVAPFGHETVLRLHPSALLSVSLVNWAGAPCPNFLVLVRGADGYRLRYLTGIINWNQIREKFFFLKTDPDKSSLPQMITEDKLLHKGLLCLHESSLNLWWTAGDGGTATFVPSRDVLESKMSDVMVNRCWNPDKCNNKYNSNFLILSLE